MIASRFYKSGSPADFCFITDQIVMVVVKWDDRMHLTSNELDGNDDEKPTCEGVEEATSIQWQHIKLMEGGMLVTSSRTWDTHSLLLCTPTRFARTLPGNTVSCFYFAAA